MASPLTPAVPLFAGNPSFNAQHSPVGAFFSFTCGLAGRRCGMAAELGRPANQDLYVGVKDGTAHEPGVPTCFPFFEGAKEDPTAAYLATMPPEKHHQSEVRNLAVGEWGRRYGWATDTFEGTTDRAAGLSFKIHTPWDPIPDPATASHAELREALWPGVRAEVTLDNRQGKTTRTVFFAISFDQSGVRPLGSGLGPGRVGFALRRSLGVAAESNDGKVGTFMRWTLSDGLRDTSNPISRLGHTPGVYLEVPAGKVGTLRVSIGCHLAGVVTTGLEGTYFYSRYYPTLESVVSAGLDTFDAAVARSAELDAKLLGSGLSADQQFLLAHATRSYHGSTQLLDVAGEPFWIVNEGEYCMMNTLDLSVDQLFWEMGHNPWVVRNLLDHYVRHYSFIDTVGGRGEAKTRPGGMSFCHDMGVHNQFSPHGQSSYEMTDLDAICFSHMTAEQLCNWVLMAATYVKQTGDTAWAKTHAHLFEALGESLLNRCGEGGVISFDSARCGTGAEITTYDSLDHSLAQTRNNLYMAVKGWATFLGVRELLMAAHAGDGVPASGFDSWTRYAFAAAETVRRQAGPDGLLPAVFEKDNSGYASRILPAVEGLAYPLAWKSDLAPFGSLLETLKTHTLACLNDPQKRNHFPDGGVRLSSTSANSWLSKIFIFQHVCRAMGWGTEFAKADHAHVTWLTTGASTYWAMSDQIVDGVAKGSKYYPRCVTAWLWLAR